MRLTSQSTGGRLSTQIIGVLETDVLCLFLGKVWKMRSPHSRQPPHLSFSANGDAADWEDTKLAVPPEEATGEQSNMHHLSRHQYEPIDRQNFG